MAFRFTFPELKTASRFRGSWSSAQYHEVHNVAMPQLMAIVDERIEWAKARIDKGDWSEHLTASEAIQQWKAFPSIIKELRTEIYHNLLDVLIWRMSKSRWSIYCRSVYAACNAVDKINKLAR